MKLRISRSTLVKDSSLLLSLLAVSVSCQNKKEKEERGNPNVVFILADDLGWSQLGCYGSDYYHTPNIDQLADEGMRFINAYSAAAVSSPTRASLMTGKYPARLNLTDFIAGNQFPDKPLKQPEWKKYLPLKENTPGELFKSKNYATAWYGKWHLSKSKTPPESRSHNPTKQGFDEEFVTYKPAANYPLGGWQKSGEDPHSVDTLTDLTTRFIRRHQDSSFFVAISHNTVHDPLKEDEARIEYYKNKPASEKPQNHPVLAAMIETLDKSVGRILRTLEKHNLEENTLVIFYSDNGGKVAYASQEPFRKGKGWLYEGGIRVSLVARFPGVIPENTTNEELVISNDFYPTFCSLLNKPVPEESTDGVNIMPLLKGEKDTLSRNTLYWHYPHYHKGSGMQPAGAIRQNNYKLIVWYEELLMDAPEPFELYNLKKDPGETTNLADDLPGKTRELFKKFKKWQQDVDAQMPELRSE
jgi:uncharacterized sulfatase